MQNKDWFDYLKVPFCTATVSGVISLCVYPLELLNTVVKTAPKLQSVKITALQLYKKEGLKAFYRGTGLLLFENFATNMIYFFLYDYLNKSLSQKYQDRNIKQRWTIPLITSFVSETACLLLYVPCDTILKRMQAHSAAYNYTSFFDGVRSVCREEGFLRLFQSSYLFMTNALIITTIQFSVYEWIKSYHKHRFPERSFGVAETLGSTVAATSLAVLASNPFDTLVIKHQMVNFVADKHQHTLRIVGEEISSMGLRTFTKGITLRLASVNAGALALIPFYEMFRQKYGMEINL